MLRPISLFTFNFDASVCEYKCDATSRSLLAQHSRTVQICGILQCNIWMKNICFGAHSLRLPTAVRNITYVTIPPQQQQPSSAYQLSYPGYQPAPVQPAYGGFPNPAAPPPSYLEASEFLTFIYKKNLLRPWTPKHIHRHLHISASCHTSLSTKQTKKNGFYKTKLCVTTFCKQC